MKWAALLAVTPFAALADLPAWDGHWVSEGDSCEEAEPHVYDGAMDYYLKTDCTVTRAERLDLPGAWRISAFCQEDAREFEQDYMLLLTLHERMFIWYGEDHSYPVVLERCAAS